MGKKASCEVHTLTRYDGRVWSCSRCPYVLYSGQWQFLMGKRTHCHECQQVFVVDTRAVKSPQLICDDCWLGVKVNGKPVHAEEFEKEIDELIEKSIKEKQAKSDPAIERIRELNEK